MKKVQKANGHEDVCVSIGTSSRICEVVARLSNIDIFQKLIPNYVGTKKIPKMLKMLKAEEAKMEKTEMLITWKDDSVYCVVDNNGKPEFQEYQGVTYTELENQIRTVIEGQVDSEDIEEFVNYYMLEIAEKTAFSDQIRDFISKMRTTLDEDATSGDFYENIKQSLSAIKVSKGSRKQIIKFLQTIEDELKKSVDAHLTSSFFKNLDNALKSVTFAKTEKVHVKELMDNIQLIDAMNREFSENCMVIEGSNSEIYQKILNDSELKFIRKNGHFSHSRYVSSREEELCRYITTFAHYLENAVNADVKSFNVCKNFPTFNNEAIHFNSGGNSATGYSREWWSERLGKSSYRFGTDHEYVLLLATKILNPKNSSVELGIINGDHTKYMARELLLSHSTRAELSYFSIYTDLSRDSTEYATAFIVHDIVND